MTLKYQILSSILSIGYGLLFYYLKKINNKYLNNSKVINILFTLDNTLLYFILLKKINNAFFHPYLFIELILGFIIGSYIDKKYTKWYNR